MVIFLNTLRRGQVHYVLGDDHDATNEFLRGTVERGAGMDGEATFSAAWCMVPDGSGLEFASGSILTDGTGSPLLADILSQGSQMPAWAKPVVLYAYRLSEGFVPRDRLVRDYGSPDTTGSFPFSLKTVKSI